MLGLRNYVWLFYLLIIYTITAQIVLCTNEQMYFVKSIFIIFSYKYEFFM